MGFNFKKGLTAGAAASLNSYGGMLKADREAVAEQVRLDAQQSREENMLRFKQTIKREDEQYDYDKGVERRDSDEQWKRDQIAPTAEAAAKAKRDVEGTPEAVAARKAMAAEELAEGVAKATALADAKRAVDKTERDRLLALADEGKADMTPEEYKAVVDKIKGLPVMAEAKETGKLTENQWLTQRAAKEKLLNEQMPGNTNEAATARSKEMAAWDAQNPKPSQGRRGKTIGQLEQSKKRQAEVQATIKTDEDLMVLASDIVAGDKASELTAEYLTPEQQQKLTAMVEAKMPVEAKSGGVLNIKPENKKIKYRTDVKRTATEDSIASEQQKIIDYKKRQAEARRLGRG